jgi:hypothetical protein
MASVIPLAGLGSDATKNITPQKTSLSPSDVHVLLVDDERLSRTVVSSLLRRCSYTGALNFNLSNMIVNSIRISLAYLILHIFSRFFPSFFIPCSHNS